MKIDLNCDLGESFGAWKMGNDAAMIELATTVNIACGYHGGDADVMRETVELAKARGVSIGAHPGYRDLQGFGRRPFPGMKSSEIENLVAYQIGALQAIATMAGHKVTHVKAHGALSNVACEEPMTARAIASAIKAVDPNLIFVVLANSKLVPAGEAANLPMVHEVFADRAYEDDGSLVSRRKPGAVLHDAKQIAQRVVRMVDRARNALVYLTYSDRLIDGSPKNSVTVVPVDRATPIRMSFCAIVARRHRSYRMPAITSCRPRSRRRCSG